MGFAMQIVDSGLEKVLFQLAILCCVLFLTFLWHFILKLHFGIKRKKQKKETEEEYLETIDTVNELQKRFFLHPTEFEHYMAMIFHALGFDDVTVTSASNDGGKDIIMYKDGRKCIAEVKLYSREYLIGREKIQKLHSAMLDSDAATAVFVTTSDFTKTAMAYAGKHEIELINGFLLHRLIQEVQKGTTHQQADIVYLKDFISKDFDTIRRRDEKKARVRATPLLFLYLVYGSFYLLTSLKEQNWVCAGFMIVCLSVGMVTALKLLLWKGNGKNHEA